MIKVGSKWMFPEDETTDGGTFEHRKRMKEMQDTEARARELTAMASKKGAHHISDYLPKGVSDRSTFVSIQKTTKKPKNNETIGAGKVPEKGRRGQDWRPPRRR